MSERDLAAFRVRAVAALTRVADAASNAESVEAGLNEVTRAVFHLLGDRGVHHRPGALKDGEGQFFVAGIFMALPKLGEHLLVAEHGFPVEQHRLRVPIDIGHPGKVWQTQAPLILANTDDHDEFKQILKTARMGSALYAPMFWRGDMLGQLICAAQARSTFSEIDLEILSAFAGIASLAFIAGGGIEWLAELTAA